MKINYKKDLFKILLFYWTIPILTTLLLYPLLPVILNYPPDSIDNTFQIEFEKISYTQQYAILVLLIIFSSLIILFIRVFKIMKCFSTLEKGQETLTKNETSKIILKVRSFCMNTPYLLYFLEILIPLTFLPITFILIKAPMLTIIKICLIYISFFTLGSIISFIFSKNQFRHILTKLHNIYPEIMDDIEFNFNCKKKNPFKSLTIKLILQLCPLIFIALIITSLVGYVQATKSKGELYYKSYHYFLNDCLNKTFNDVDDIKQTLSEIGVIDNSHIYFIIDSNGNYITSTGETLEPFFIKYTLEKSDLQNGRTFDYYCLDSEGIAIKCIDQASKTYYAGFLYRTSQPSFIYFIIISNLVLFIIIFIILLYVSCSLSQDIKIVTENLNQVANNNKNNLLLDKNLVVTSEDEIANLIVAFNLTQELINQNINQLENNQNILMERERLASLGQLIGGIAHNLKTPIMSISGAAEGLKDLVKEYELSIGDPEVTYQDHHDIAKDMHEWIIKIKNYTEYMSDIITAVKGQAVNMNDEQDYDNFTLDELIKRIDILMKHELKHSLTYLNVNMKVNSNITLKGNINSLVQVIDNMISNSIQAYNGKTDRNINMTVENINNKIVISIEDFAGGLPKKVQDKLFKEMITTKGKNGTGLGLFMSYSTIRAHFNGNIKFETEEGKGTTFHIILPL